MTLLINTTIIVVLRVIIYVYERMNSLPVWAGHIAGNLRNGC